MKQNAVQRFTTTQWSVVLGAKDMTSASAQAALEQLCSRYWYPLYAYVRRRGCSLHEAQDLTQGFLADLLNRNAIESVHPNKGRFRSFLIASLNHFLSNERDRARAGKRGGGIQPVFLDQERAEERFRNEPVTDDTPEKIYDRKWALTVLARAKERLRDEYALAGKKEKFDSLWPIINQDDLRTYAEVAKAMGTTGSAIKNEVPRMKQRYLEMVRNEVAQTIGSLADLDDELQYLMIAVGR